MKLNLREVLNSGLAITLIATLFGSFFGSFFSYALVYEPDFSISLPAQLVHTEKNYSADAKIIVKDKDSIWPIEKPYSHQIYLTVGDLPKGLNVAFSRNAINNLADNGVEESTINITTRDFLPAKIYEINILARGGDGKEKNCILNVDVNE
jgi:hypothetical protein